MVEEKEVACFIIRSTDHKIDEFRLKLSRSFPNLFFQFVDPRLGANERFFRMIAFQTMTAMTNGTLLAKKPEVDLLLRLAGTTQISQAIAKAGYKKRGAPVLIAAGARGGVRRLLRSGMIRGARLRSRPLTADEFRRIEEAAVVSTWRS